MDPELLGSWSATRWQYTSKVRREHVVDVVAGLKGTVTMSLSAGAFVVACVCTAAVVSCMVLPGVSAAPRPVTAWTDVQSSTSNASVRVIRVTVRSR